ncbi:hypothetical protein [Frankia sp. CiP3]|nr:hypothetical protein [Frankia sp. CiP3]
MSGGARSGLGTSLRLVVDVASVSDRGAEIAIIVKIGLLVVLPG